MFANALYMLYVYYISSVFVCLVKRDDGQIHSRY